MIPSRAIKVYKTVASREEFVTTVFNGYDATRILDRIAYSKEAQLSTVTFKSVTDKVLQKVSITTPDNRGSKYRSYHKVRSYFND